MVLEMVQSHHSENGWTGSLNITTHPIISLLKRNACTLWMKPLLTTTALQCSTIGTKSALWASKFHGPSHNSDHQENEIAKKCSKY